MHRPDLRPLLPLLGLFTACESPPPPSEERSSVQDSWALAWGDYDGDGDPDLAIATAGAPNRIYRNTGGTLELVWTSEAPDSTFAVAWADMDADGDLDVAFGGRSVTRVYAHEPGDRFPLAWSSFGPHDTKTLAWGDVDADGDLDLVTTGRATQLYANWRGMLYEEAEVPTSTWHVAFVELDGTAPTELALGGRRDGRDELPNLIVEVDDTRFAPEGEFAPGVSVQAMDWGDYDGDGDPDLVVAHPIQVFANDGGRLRPVWVEPDSNRVSTDVAWGDSDGDGDLDIAAAYSFDPDGDGNRSLANQVLRNEGASFALAWSSTERDPTKAIAWADVDGDGDLDLAAANFGHPDRIYKSVSGELVLAQCLTMDETIEDDAPCPE